MSTSAVVDAARKAAEPQPPTLDEIKGWPATVDVARAGAAIGLSRSYSYELVRRNEFPARVITAGRRYVVVTASLVALLEDQAA